MKKQSRKRRKPLKTLVIDRAKWGRHYLKRIDDGKMCCLGFACLAVGHRAIVGVPMPYSLRTRLGPKWLYGYGLAQKAAEANDSYCYKREETVARIFAEVGCKVTFIGEYES